MFDVVAQIKEARVSGMGCSEARLEFVHSVFWHFYWQDIFQLVHTIFFLLLLFSPFVGKGSSFAYWECAYRFMAVFMAP